MVRQFAKYMWIPVDGLITNDLRIIIINIEGASPHFCNRHLTGNLQTGKATGRTNCDYILVSDTPPTLISFGY
jgi:hypothetical protein